MEYNHVPSFPICTLKVDIKCCDECPIKLKKKLLKTNGVTSVDIDSKKGKVTVMGDIDPRILMQMFEKMGKPAELWSFQKSPSQESGCNKKKKEARFACDDDDDDMDDVSEDEYLPKRSSGTRRPMHGNNHGRDSFSQRSSAPFFRSSRITPRPPSRSSTIFPNPIMYSGPSGYYRPPPLSLSGPAYGYGYEYFPSRPLTKYNPMIHYTSYWDNYRLSP
ncbi:hypothetical protein I3843_08G083800 [Carya illinoinensis]|uniref:heavy metal-associated isoprenylated plant protein 36-like n=1 Tax=Carya illinoinensis TaxID=32201 RepID=UPI001C720B81|nr:heavy metal-associated isoprenylated plant protein 36-like [Carya illinoinensis]KAG7967129.1 hypothetical protein I3843_08G083800 [Carya illinoinensis]